MFQPLSATVAELLDVVGVGDPPSDLRTAAAELAVSHFGEATVNAVTSLVNVDGLALAMRRRLTVYQLSEGASRRVHETDLHSLPGEAPRLLRGPFIVEAKAPDGLPLFASSVSLGGYIIGENVFLVGVDYPDGARVARWAPRWGELDLDAGLPVADHSPLIDDVDGHMAWAREAARFVLVLGLLLDAEGSPVLVSDEVPRARRRRGGPGEVRHGWVTRRVYLDPKTSSGRSADHERAGEALLDGLVPLAVDVRGHLKRQPFGPGRCERRWVYVEGYSARRWVAPRPLRVVVS